mmetsp:Transcript_24112/g.47353  ORF Transcript_24112/g.47353 Transcript_24112/m.47353 type:complete len:242 (-) Transcript_24112:283-1008(-)
MVQGFDRDAASLPRVSSEAFPIAPASRGAFLLWGMRSDEPPLLSLRPPILWAAVSEICAATPSGSHLETALLISPSVQWRGDAAASTRSPVVHSTPSAVTAAFGFPATSLVTPLACSYSNSYETNKATLLRAKQALAKSASSSSSPRAIRAEKAAVPMSNSGGGGGLSATTALQEFQSIQLSLRLETAGCTEMSFPAALDRALATSLKKQGFLRSRVLDASSASLAAAVCREVTRLFRAST